MDRTAHLDLPYVMPSQAQKHVTHNEALAILDALVNCSVEDRDRAAPPAQAAEGQRHLVAAGAFDAWAGKDGLIAVWRDGAWAFLVPGAGLLVYVKAESLLVLHDGTAFRAPLSRTDRLGVNTDAADDRRLTVSSETTLLTHQGGDHRLILDKAAPGDTASLVFQDGFSGRAEIGLAGSDALSVKVSADGAAWREAMTIDPPSGNIGVNAAPTERLRIAEGNVRIGWNLLSAEEADGGAAMEIMYYGSGDRNAFFDFHACDAHSDYSARFIRQAGEHQPFGIFNHGGGGMVFANHDAAPIAFSSAGQPRMTIAASGSVGIGTQAPTTALDVRGVVRIGSFAVGGLPPATSAGPGALAWAEDATGGAALVCCTGTDWRKVADAGGVS